MTSARPWLSEHTENVRLIKAMASLLDLVAHEQLPALP